MCDFSTEILSVSSCVRGQARVFSFINISALQMHCTAKTAMMMTAMVMVTLMLLLLKIMIMMTTTIDDER